MSGDVVCGADTNNTGTLRKWMLAIITSEETRAEAGDRGKIKRGKIVGLPGI